MDPKEKRIYVVVAQRVEAEPGLVVQPDGRQMAQVGHVLRRLGMVMSFNGMLRFNGKKLTREMVILGTQYQDTTTIVLSCRDSWELAHVESLLVKGKVEHVFFEDTNTAAYGASAVITALATFPVSREEIEGILDYLPLWGSERHLK